MTQRSKNLLEAPEMNDVQCKTYNKVYFYYH